MLSFGNANVGYIYIDLENRAFIRKSEGLGKSGFYMYIRGSQKIRLLCVNQRVSENQAFTRKSEGLGKLGFYT